MKTLIGAFLGMVASFTVSFTTYAVPFNYNNFSDASTNFNFRTANFTNVSFGLGGANSSGFGLSQFSFQAAWFGQGGTNSSSLVLSQFSFQKLTCPLCQSVNVLSLNVLRLTGSPNGLSLALANKQNLSLGFGNGSNLFLSNGSTLTVVNNNTGAVPIPGTLLLF